MRSALFLRRHPGDLLRAGLGLSILLVSAAFVRPDAVGTVETNTFRLINDFPLPDWTWPAVWLVMQFGNIASVPATAFAAAAARRWRLALDFAVAGGTIYLVAKLIKTLVERGRPQTLLDAVHILGEPARGLGYVSGHSAVAIALATVAAPYLGRRTRRLVWAGAISVCLFRIYVGAHLPLDVVGGMALGWAAGATAHLVLGAPEGHVAPQRVRRALERLGFTVEGLAHVGAPSRRSASFHATRPDGPDLFVKVAARERRDDDLLYRGWRALRRRWTGPAHTGSGLRQVEHEACMGAMAAAAGVRTPALVYAGPFGNGSGMLVQEWVDSVRLDAVASPGGAVLDEVHREVGRLHAAGVAHGDLQADSILVDAGMQPWLVDFSRASAADVAARAQDMATLDAVTRTGSRPSLLPA